MWMHHPRDVAELFRDARRGGFCEIENEGLSRAERVGEELVVGRHGVLGVVRAVRATWHRKRRYERAIAIGTRLLADVVDREKIWTGAVRRRCPQIEVVARRR